MKPTTLLALGLALACSSCSEKKETPESAPATTQHQTDELSSLLLNSAPEDAIDITKLRSSGKVGDSVTFTGQIMGSDTVFMDGRAVMIVGDPEKLTPCNLNPDDHCKTPWDACCDTPEMKKASIVTVQVIDKTGKPIANGLKGLGGLSELSEVTITGEVAKGSTDSNMLINASGIFVKSQ